MGRETERIKKNCDTLPLMAGDLQEGIGEIALHHALKQCFVCFSRLFYSETCALCEHLVGFCVKWRPAPVKCERAERKCSGSGLWEISRVAGNRTTSPAQRHQEWERRHLWRWWWSCWWWWWGGRWWPAVNWQHKIAACFILYNLSVWDKIRDKICKPVCN